MPTICKFCKENFSSFDKLREHIEKDEPEGFKILQKIKQEQDDLEYAAGIGNRLWKTESK